MADIIIVACYIVAVLSVGIYYSRNIKSMSDFSSSNKTFSAPVIMATISATYIGGEFLFGIAEKSFQFGSVFFFTLLATCLGKWFIAHSVVPRVSKYSSLISIGEIMQESYGTVGRIVTGLSGALLSIGYVGAQIGACATLFNYFFAVPHVIGIMIACSIVVIYSAFGGFKAVTFTDVIQFAVLMVAVPIICNYALNQIGGYPQLIAALPATHIIPPQESLLEHFAWFMVFLVPFLDPALMQRMTMDRDAKKVASAWRLSALVDVPFYLVVCTIGAIALVRNPGIEPTSAFVSVIASLPQGLTGLAIAGVLAVVMSTADSYLNVASISLVHDVIKPISGKAISDKAELRLAQFMTMVLGVLAIVAALSFKSVLDLVVSFMNYSWVPLVTAPLYARIFGFKIGPKPFVIAGICAIGSQFMWPFLFGIESEVFALMISPFMSAAALFGSHFIIEKKWPRLSAAPSSKAKRSVSSWPSDLEKAKREPLLDRFLNISSKRVESFGASYSLFGIFAVLNYIVPYFMWSTADEANFNLHLAMRFIAAALSFGLIVHDYWPPVLQRFLPAYWHFTLLFCLPFFSTFMLLDNNGSTFWVYNIVLGLFLLAALVDWMSFVVLLIVGLSAGCGLFYLLPGNSFTNFNIENSYLVAYMYIFAVMIGIIFSRRNEKIIQEKMQLLKTLGASIAHEMRTPLATIAAGASSLKKYLPLYGEVYQNACEAGLQVPHFGRKEQILLRDIPSTMEKVSNNAQNMINMLLMNVKEKPVQNYETCSISHCIKTAIERYPLKDNENQIIHWDNSKDFLFVGREEMVLHVLFNLIKNSLYQLTFVENRTIHIELVVTDASNYLHFKDSGNGVSALIMPHIFDRFVSGTEFGSGLGLAYCKMAMNAIGGDIECVSREGEGAEFVLRFPKT